MKDILTEAELGFLARHRLGPEDVMDVRGISQWLWKSRIKEKGKKIALGSRCKRAGHRLRSRAGHCVQCDPKKLAFQARYSAEQYVYIAGSLSDRLIKIGTCGNRSQREEQLQREKYGSIGDWKFLYSVKVRNAGEVERSAQSRLWEYTAPARQYWKDNIEQYATELLQCSFSRAKAALEEVSADAKVEEPWQRRFILAYEFEEPEPS